LTSIHDNLEPRGYLEIGVAEGASIALARCPAIGLDPEPNIMEPLPRTTRIVASTSDSYFEAMQGRSLDIELDLAFIDGMHLAEFALRDFISIERHAHAGTLVLFDDVLPNHPRQASRKRATGIWTGDVWKVIECLREWRPDLALTLLNTSPGGMLAVSGVDPENTALHDHYTVISQGFVDAGDAVPDRILDRRGATDPFASNFLPELRALKLSRQ
jgi:hypothetical protein